MSLRVKGILVLVVLVGSIVAIIPTFQAYRPGGNPQAIKNKVNLGLDLQGGMYLDVEVRTEAAVTRVLDRIAEEIEDLLLDKLVDYNYVERRGNEVEVSLPPGEKVDWAEEPFGRLLRNLTVDSTAGNLHRVTLPEGEADRIREGSVDQALEVIRNRIDSLGVNEPSIQ
ncbi:MAG: protein translocase subunit SecD, partial [SAR324 cluster bacterium]|nr:protein translocase subunit SecD [SAR324 cluster bacterium]